MATALLIFIAASARAQNGPFWWGAGNAAQGGSDSSDSGPQGMSAQGTLSQNNFSGSVPGKLEPGVLQLSLQDALARGLKQNLGLLVSGENVRAARGERWRQLSALLPNLTTSTYANASQVDLAEYGFTFKFSPSSGVSIPAVVGPFYYLDSRAYVTQSIFDWKAINNKSCGRRRRKVRTGHLKGRTGSRHSRRRI